MNTTRSPYAELVIRVEPVSLELEEKARRRRSVESDPDLPGLYEAHVYSTTPELQDFVGGPIGDLAAWNGMPPIARGPIVIRWGRYQEYLRLFLAGEKSHEHMRERLLETLPVGIENLFGDSVPISRPLRVWWANMAPELEELPWELLMYGWRYTTTERFSFVRGAPPLSPPPLVPVAEKLRLAFIHKPRSTHPALKDALKQLPGIEVIAMTGPPREELLRAAREGFELVHIVADGSVSLAYEGVLDLGDMPQASAARSTGSNTGAQMCSSSELSTILRGSRVTVLCLAPPRQKWSMRGTPDVELHVPEVFRAYAHLSSLSTNLQLPSIVAPLGPITDPDSIHHFWREFYTHLANTYSVETAVAQGRSGRPPLPIALFLQHPQGKVFRRGFAPYDLAPESAPTQADATRQISEDLVERLEALNVAGDLPESVSALIASERGHQQRIQSALEPWQQAEEGEI